MRRTLRVLTIAILGIALVVACGRIDWQSIGATISSARLMPVVVATLLNVVARTLLRVRRTQLLIGRRVAWPALLRIHLAGYAAGTLLPGPAEEVFCSIRLATAHGFETRELVRLQLVDKTLAVVSIGLVAIALLPIGVAVPLAGIAVVAVAIALPRRRALVALLVVWNAMGVAMIGLCLFAVGADLTPVGWLEVFVATSIGGALPLLPGQIGTLESAFALVAAHHGVPASSAIAAALLYRLTYAPTAIAGLPLLWTLPAKGQA